MDGQAKTKALFRAKLNARKQEKSRIDSPFVRYNENDQLVCRICDVIIKSETLWPGHQSSRKHHEAYNKLKASAAALNQPNNAKSSSELPKPQAESSRGLNDKSEGSASLPTHRSSTLPSDFFDNHETKRQKTERDSGKPGNRDSHKKESVSAKTQVEEAFLSGSGTDRPSTAASTQMRNPEFQVSEDFRQVSKATTGSEAKQVKGALPEGFFDDKDADLRARGITPVKPDAKDEYKEFEKLIQEDLHEVDNRLEEEEFDAAEMIEEEETVEQRAYKERVEMLRRKKLEMRAAKSAASLEDTRTTHKESRDEDSSSDEEDNENFKVDWRAKHL